MEKAKELTDLYFDFDPFSGADYDEVLQATEEALKTKSGCMNIINELIEMLTIALK